MPRVPLRRHQRPERAPDWLTKACELRDSGLIWLRVMPLYDPLRAAPRFRHLLERVGLPSS